MQGRGVSTLLFLDSRLLLLFCNHSEILSSLSLNRKDVPNEEIMESLYDGSSFPNLKPNLSFRLFDIRKIFPGNGFDVEYSLFTRNLKVHQIIHSNLMNETIFIVPFAWFWTGRIVMEEKSFLVMILLFWKEIRM